jgi:hypothetical protein
MDFRFSQFSEENLNAALQRVIGIAQKELLFAQCKRVWKNNYVLLAGK